MKQSSTRYLGVDYCETADDVTTPYCPHGPTIQFRRFLRNKPSRIFYACALHRTRKKCPFFQWTDSSIDKKRQNIYLKMYRKNKSKYKWKILRKRLISFTSYPSDESRRVCLTCETILLEGEREQHKNHLIREDISLEQVLQPSRIFLPHTERTSLAQELFTDTTLQVITNNIHQFGIHSVICIGTPTLHEYLLSDNTRGVSTFLLDLDPKYSQFYNPNLYQRFNLFNKHFFSSGGTVKLQRFISSTKLTDVLVVCDMPFGAKIDLIHSSLKRLWRVIGWDESALPGGVPTLWIFPYFNRKEIAEKTNFIMLQFKVEYEVKYSRIKRGSPVRVFTNIPLQSFKLPTESNEYKLCKPCGMFVFNRAYHCNKCNSCESADGDSYHHCDICNTCVKESSKHCMRCETCHPARATCLQPLTRYRCHVCKDISHKRRDCPLNTIQVSD